MDATVVVRVVNVFVVSLWVVMISIIIVVVKKAVMVYVFMEFCGGGNIVGSNGVSLSDGDGGLVEVVVLQHSASSQLVLHWTEFD